MTLAQLSHTPMTKEGGRSYQKNVGEINSHFNKMLNSMRRSTAEWKREMRKPIRSSVQLILDPGESDEYNIGA